MAKQLTPKEQVESPESIRRGSTQPMVVMPHYGPGDQEPQYVELAESQPQRAIREPSYHPYKWEPANRVLDVVDRASRGRAGWMQRLVTYLIIGGCAAVVNLIVLAAVLYKVPWPAHQELSHYIVAEIVAYELSILANFIPNDYITFRHLSGHSRSWWQRCVRFHITSIGGIIVTQVISSGLHYGLNMQALVAQAIALIVATAFNFSFHHIFTYRHVKEAPVAL